MTEAIYYGIGGVGLATVLAAFNAWLERKSGRWTSIAIKERLAHRLMASAAGDRARKAAYARAMGQVVRLD